MDYRNTETKIDQLVGYFNDRKINLTPIFQRGKVWNVKTRRELVKNIVRRRPIPAIFLYKDEAGSKYTYNILDGKQRLESILMFIGKGTPDFGIKTWHEYIFGKLHRANVGFWIDLGQDGKKKKKFTDLDEKTLRDFKEYPIPTIEIALNDNTSLDEMISLFVDINQYGVKVTRLDIVKAMKQKDPLLREVFGMIAERQVRQQDTFAKSKKTSYTGVLKHLQIVSSVADPNAQADRMWEKLFELALFVRSGGKHRKPTEILKTFIKAPGEQLKKLSREEKSKLGAAFDFLKAAYKNGLVRSRMATDQTHFYTMVTSLLNSDLLDTIKHEDLTARLGQFGRVIDGKEKAPKSLSVNVRNYLEVSAKQTTDVSRRESRQREFLTIIRGLGT